jgi:hypothetical protein
MPYACRYDFPLGDVVLEEALLMDTADCYSVLQPALHAPVAKSQCLQV